jgi:hypothetical protein
MILVLGHRSTFLLGAIAADIHTSRNKKATPPVIWWGGCLFTVTFYRKATCQFTGKCLVRFLPSFLLNK